MKKILSILFISSSLVFAGNNNEIGLDTIVGGTIGVIIGNQIGKGTGKDVARVAGGLLGASIANSSRDSRNYNNNNYNNNNNDNYRNDSYNNYERTTTYIRKDYYDDRYYDRRPTQVVVIYNDTDRRRPPYREYHGHHKSHRDYVYREERYMGR
jgi:uncharacterized protein YcfJ